MNVKRLPFQTESQLCAIALNEADTFLRSRERLANQLKSKT